MNMRKVIVLTDADAWGDLDKARVCLVPEGDVIGGQEDHEKRAMLIERGVLRAAFEAGVELDSILTYFRYVVQELHDIYGPEGPEDSGNPLCNQDSYLYAAENVLLQIDGEL